MSPPSSHGEEGRATEALFAGPIASTHESMRSIAGLSASPTATVALMAELATIALETTALAFGTAILGRAMLERDLAELRRTSADLEAHLAAGTTPGLQFFAADQLPPDSYLAREAASLERVARLLHEEMMPPPIPLEMPDLSALTPFDKAALRAALPQEGALAPVVEPAAVVDLAEGQRGRISKTETSN